MKTHNKKCVISLVALCLIAASHWACSNGTAGTSDDPNQVVASIRGVAEKGPFVKGTTVTLYELSPETFAQTGKTFAETVEGDDGSFSLGGIELGSQYVLLDATGYYWNELSGERSTKPLTLRAIAHIKEKDKVNVNIGTSIVYKRILDLVEAGLGFDEAKAQAESELMEAFFGEEEGIEFEKASILDNEHLLALSQVVLSAEVESEIIEIIATLAKNLKDSTALVTLADRSAMKYEYGKSVRSFMENRFPDAEIGPFEKYAVTFWRHIYGLDPCVKGNVGVLDTIHASKSENDGRIVICKAVENDYRWEMATDVEIATVDIEPDSDGTIHFVKKIGYVYDGEGWRKATEREITIGKGCIEKVVGAVVVTEEDDYVCRKKGEEFVWTPASIFDFTKDSFFNESVKYGSVQDKRDGHVYRTVKIEDRTWMAENLSYVVDGAHCRDSLTVGCLYVWSMALDLAKDEALKDVNQGLCMDGWHVPDTTEWNSLLKSNKYADLLSEVGWLDGGNNGTGFSAVPSFYTLEDPSLYGIADYSYREDGYTLFIAVNKARMSDSYFERGFMVEFDFNRASVTLWGKDRNQNPDDMFDYAALRCVKDSE